MCVRVCVCVGEGERKVFVYRGVRVERRGCVCVHVSMCGGRVLSVSACVCKRVRACVSERERALQKQISALISKNVIEVSIDQGKKT